MTHFWHSRPPGRRPRFTLFGGLALGFWLLSACSDEGEPSPITTGQTCTSAAQCYPGVADGELQGAAACLDKVTNGYCTHECTQDSDCCATAGECPDNHAEVCGPFESTGRMYCFLSCEDSDLEDAKLTDADQYCHRYAGPAFGCRSTGGGSKNRKVCVP